MMTMKNSEQETSKQVSNTNHPKTHNIYSYKPS